MVLEIKVEPKDTLSLRETVIRSRFQAACDEFNSFCQQTSLHGWQYLENGNNKIQKTFWTSVILISIVAGIGSTYYNIINYINSGTTTSISSTTAPLKDVTFPDFIVCNENQVSASFLRSINIEATDRYDKSILLSHFLKGYKTVEEEQENGKRLKTLLELMKSKHQWNESMEFHTVASQKCNDLILYAKWRGKTIQIQNDQEQSPFYRLATDFGACCEINTYLHFEQNVSEPTVEDWLNIPKGFSRNGIKNGLYILLDAEVFDYAYFEHSAQGFRAAVDDANNKALINQLGFNIGTGTSKLVTMSMTIHNTTEEALTLDPEVRDCYVPSEMPLKYLTPERTLLYSMGNCLYDVVIDKILKHCKCAPPFAAKWNLMDPCMGTNLSCAMDWEDNLGSSTFKNEDLTKIMTNDAIGNPVLKPCLQTCQYQLTQTTQSISTFPNAENFSHRREFCLTMKKIVKICKDQYKRITFEEKYGSRISCQEILYAHNVQDMCSGKLPSIDHLQKYRGIAEFLQLYASENLAYVKLFIKDPFYTKITRDKAITFITFIGNAGGLLGLSMGFSLVTICEIVYHAFQFLMKSKTISAENSIDQQPVQASADLIERVQMLENKLNQMEGARPRPSSA